MDKVFSSDSLEKSISGEGGWVFGIQMLSAKPLCGPSLTTKGNITWLSGFQLGIDNNRGEKMTQNAGIRRGIVLFIDT